MSLGNLSWQVLIILGSSLTALGQIFNKYQVHRGASLQVHFYKYLASVPLITWLWWRSGLGWPENWLIFWFYGMLGGISVVLWAKAIRFNLSQTNLLTPAVSLLSIALAAILLQEWQLFNIYSVSGRKIILALLLLPVLFYCFYDKKDVKVKEWSILAWLPILFVASSRTFLKHFLGQVEPLQIQFLQYWGSIAVVIGGLKWKKHKFYLGKTFAIRGWLQGLIAGVGLLLYYMGLQQASVTQTSLLRQVVMLTITISAGLFVWQEIKDMSRKKWMGLAVAVVMMILVATTTN